MDSRREASKSHRLGTIPCKVCGCLWRNNWNGTCLDCEKKRDKKRNDVLSRLQRAGLTFYEGTPCKKCGSRVKAYRACYSCTLTRARKWKRTPQGIEAARRRGILRRKYKVGMVGILAPIFDKDHRGRGK